MTGNKYESTLTISNSSLQAHIFNLNAFYLLSENPFRLITSIHLKTILYIREIRFKEIINSILSSPHSETILRLRQGSVLINFGDPSGYRFKIR